MEITPPEPFHYVEPVNYYGTAETGKPVLEAEENNLDNPTQETNNNLKHEKSVTNHAKMIHFANLSDTILKKMFRGTY
ncbi:hypothetical protein [Arsenophonus endosymbiont of Aleurodicus floccissimus]|uniref:hypothetical protein n=1 Tax=Arsenophonus endosymbiont of Aleurodicus floccissimus TaxID=2152761 RepID=UPI000E6B4A72|nr:hypothetical protein [Arsenophonus endosymbiont of Aleurodicus floccissimus]